jgi:hypothetical protein
MQKRKSQLLGLDRRQRQICPFCMAELMVATAATAAQIGGYTRVGRAEGLLRSVIGAVVQGTRRRENIVRIAAFGFSGWSPGAVQFFQGLQGDNTKACRSAHKAFCETSVREALAALLDELGREFGPGRTVPGR